ncbi:glycosyltransferase family 2 protein [Patescibacteria group bacterium]
MTKLSVILPVYQQEDIIAAVYKEIYQAIKGLKINFECILVENGSTDETLSEVKKLTKIYRHTKFTTTTKGYGSAVIEGLTKARGKYICYMPSDGQVDLEKLKPLWKLAQTNKYEIVKVRRSTRESLLRTCTTKFHSYSLAFKFDTPLIDINGSPRILSRKNMLSLKLKYRDSFIDSEILIKAHNRGWKIKEIPMKNIPRYGGKSSRSYKTYTEFLKNIISYK